MKSRLLSAKMLIKILAQKSSGRFVLVGVVNTTIDVLVFSLFYQFGSSVIIVNTAAFFVANAMSYFLNRKFTFFDTAPVYRNKLLHYTAFLAMSLCTLALSNILLYVLTPITSVVLAKILTIGLVMSVNFVIMKKLLFRSSLRN